MQNSLLQYRDSTIELLRCTLHFRVGEAPNAVPFGKYSELVPSLRSHSRRLSFWLYGWPNGRLILIGDWQVVRSRVPRRRSVPKLRHSETTRAVRLCVRIAYGGGFFVLVVVADHKIGRHR